MADEENAEKKEAERIAARNASVRKAFTGFFQTFESDQLVMINGANVTKLSAKPSGEGWEVTLFLTDGSTHSVNNDWSKTFAEEVFGKEALAVLTKP